jgi:hypothetical protein
MDKKQDEINPAKFAFGFNEPAFSDIMIKVVSHEYSHGCKVDDETDEWEKDENNDDEDYDPYYTPEKEEGKVYVCKRLFASRLFLGVSPYFRELLTGGMVESQQKVIKYEVNKMSECNAFVRAVKFIYTEKLDDDITIDDLIALLIESDKLRMTDLFGLCMDRLDKMTSQKSVYGHNKILTSYPLLANLGESANHEEKWSIIIVNCIVFCNKQISIDNPNKEFLQMPLVTIFKYLRSIQQKNKLREENFYHMLKCWWKFVREKDEYSSDELEIAANKIIDFIDIKLMSVGFLKNVFRRDNFPDLNKFAKVGQKKIEKYIAGLEFHTMAENEQKMRYREFKIVNPDTQPIMFELPTSILYEGRIDWTSKPKYMFGYWFQLAIKKEAYNIIVRLMIDHKLSDVDEKDYAINLQIERITIGSYNDKKQHVVSEAQKVILHSKTAVQIICDLEYKDYCDHRGSDQITVFIEKID